MNFHKKVVYHIYPRSFNDTTGNGYGDLNGIIEKLDYICTLGVDVVWLSPFFKSPQNDNGYDISDYYAIDPLFGTMKEFEKLVYEAEKRGMSILLDMVFNHTSIEHEWFQKALAGDKYFKDFYIIRNGKDGDLPTNWQSKFGGNTWELFGDKKNDEYYLHLFDKTQADLDWRNPNVKRELFKVLEFWIDKGVKGFRFDVINLIGKDEFLKDAPSGVIDKLMYTDKALVHDYLKEMNQATFGKYDDIITVGEMSSTSIENSILYTRPDSRELDMVFQFHHLKADYDGEDKWSDCLIDVPRLKKVLHEWNTKISEGKGWLAQFWNNMDQPRSLSRFVQNEDYYSKGAKIIAALTHLNRGTPYIFQGEEIGMRNPGFSNISDYRDVDTLNAYDEMRDKGFSDEKIFSILKKKSRDNSRTPMQWDSTKNAGFTTGVPWINVANSYSEVNVAKELSSGSLFEFYQKLIRLRKEYDVISDGDYRAYNKEYGNVYAFERLHKEDQLLVLNNISEESIEITLAEEYREASVLINNYERIQSFDTKITLMPYETLALLKR